MSAPSTNEPPGMPFVRLRRGVAPSRCWCIYLLTFFVVWNLETLKPCVSVAQAHYTKYFIHIYWEPVLCRHYLSPSSLITNPHISWNKWVKWWTAKFSYLSPTRTVKQTICIVRIKKVGKQIQAVVAVWWIIITTFNLQTLASVGYTVNSLIQTINIKPHSSQRTNCRDVLLALLELHKKSVRPPNPDGDT